MPELNGFYLIRDANLQNYWRLEGDATDTKGNNNGTSNNMSYGSSFGKFGQGGSFNGSNAYIQLAATGMQFSAPFTVAGWFKTSVGGAQNPIIANFTGMSPGHNNVGGWYLGMDLSSGTVLCFASGKDSGHTQGSDWQKTVGVTNVVDSVYHHAAGVWDGSNLLLYLDGKLESSTAWAIAPATKNPTIGNTSIDEIQKYWNGSIDDVAVFTRALTAREIAQLAASGYFQGGML